MDDGRGTRTRQVLAQPRSHVLDSRDVARAMALPEAAEAPQLAFEVAAGVAREPLQPARAPVDRVDLDERVDELLAAAAPLRRRVECRWHGAREDLAVHALHEVERRADDRRVVAHRQHPRHARRRRLERAQQARLAQDVVGARRERPARRPAQHDLPAFAPHEIGDVRVPLADRLRTHRSGPEPVRVEERLERVEHEQRLAGVVADRRAVGDDVVRRGPVHEGEVRPAATLPR